MQWEFVIYLKSHGVTEVETTLLLHIVTYSTTKCIEEKKNGGDLVQFNSSQFNCTEADINASFQSIVRKIQGLGA